MTTSTTPEEAQDAIIEATIKFAEAHYDLFTVFRDWLDGYHPGVAKSLWHATYTNDYDPADAEEATHLTSGLCYARAALAIQLTHTIYRNGLDPTTIDAEEATDLVIEKYFADVQDEVDGTDDACPDLSNMNNAAIIHHAAWVKLRLGDDYDEENVPHRIVNDDGEAVPSLNGETTFSGLSDALGAVSALAQRDLANDGIDENRPDYGDLYEEYAGRYYTVLDDGDQDDDEEDDEEDD